MDGTGLTLADFAPFFNAVWHFDPFPWQQRLLNRLVTGKGAEIRCDREPGCWPSVLDLPTGAGKTAALDIALFHLALDAAGDDLRRAPVRIAFVVDRRLIVDDAYARATSLGTALSKAIEAPTAAHPAVLKVAQALCKLAGDGQKPLVVRRLRGGAPREDDWARTPVQPTILCSTVDQVGSRLLFRGYGVSDRMKPIHAGLLGSDCLILLDEAHLSEPFRQTLKAISRLRAPDSAPFGFALLTATPKADREQSFGLDADDRADSILSVRINAPKLARLKEISGKPGVAAEAHRVDEIAAATQAVLESLQENSAAQPVIGVVVNRVTRARAVFDLLTVRLADVDLTLLIGPTRSIERDELAEEQLAPIRTGKTRARGDLEKARIVVATQTIEVGVDLDFDGLVTEAASLDALRQRFGRLNRGGRPITPQAIVLAHKDDIGAKADDAVYGDRIRKTWETLQGFMTDERLVDFGIEVLRGRLDRDEAARLATPTLDAPVLMPAYADLWSQTCPIPASDPEVALFLHGPDRSSATVQIVWRSDLRESDLQRDNCDRLAELFKLIPPRATEAVEVSLWAARAWLQQADGMLSALSDAVEREPKLAEAREAGRRAFRWAGDDSALTGVVRARGLRNGDLIVVPATYGGCDGWGWNPQSEREVIDLGEKAQWPYRGRRFAVRVTPELIAQGLRPDPASSTPQEGGGDATAVDLDRIRRAFAAKMTLHEGDSADALLEALLDTTNEPSLPAQMRDYLGALCQGKRKGRLEIGFSYDFGDEERPRGIVFVAPRGVKDADVEEAAGMPSTESDDLGSVSARPVSLIDHSCDVRHWAERFANAAGLEPDLIADVALAAFLHDAGKADPRYQAYFAGGNPYGPDTQEVLAKSGERRLTRGAWQKAGLPDKWRHEALSVRLALLHPDLAQAADTRLVLWLIGSHHGFGRPLFPHCDPNDTECRPGLLKSYCVHDTLRPGYGPQSLAFDFDGMDWAQMFEELKRRYGIWGLARLEGFVRLADHRASEYGAGNAGDAGEAREEVA